MSGGRLRVVVDGPVDARLVAPAIRVRLAGGPWPAGPERQIADAVLAERQAAGDAAVGDRDRRSANATVGVR